jgi:MSHA pilin protein MshC
MAGQFGFTMVELVTVIVIIGVLGAVAAPRLFERSAFDAMAYTDQVRGLIRYGQKLAIAQNRNVYVRLDGASVALCYDVACASRVVPPGGANSGSSNTQAQCANLSAWSCEGVPNGLAITSASTFYFDANGKPFRSTDAPPTLNSTFADLTITVSGDGLNHNTVVAAETGYVY